VRVGAGVVHQHVDAPETLHRGVDGGRRLFGLAGMRRRGEHPDLRVLRAQLGRHPVQRLLPPGGEHHVRALPRERHRDRLADPAGRAGDHRGLAGQSGLHRLASPGP
jgi:hypothetical protein